MRRSDCGWPPWIGVRLTPRQRCITRGLASWGLTCADSDRRTSQGFAGQGHAVEAEYVLARTFLAAPDESPREVGFARVELYQRPADGACGRVSPHMDGTWPFGMGHSCHLDGCSGFRPLEQPVRSNDNPIFKKAPRLTKVDVGGPWNGNGHSNRDEIPNNERFRAASQPDQDKNGEKTRSCHDEQMPGQHTFAPSRRPHQAIGKQKASTLTKTDPFVLTKIDPPLARANTQLFASERGQGRAAVFAARRSVPLTPCRGEYAREWLCARHFRAHSHDD